MAQGTVDKRFLTKSAKTASAGAILALAVVVLLLAGCGGGSSDSSSSSTAASDAIADASPDSSRAASDPAKVGSGSGGAPGEGSQAETGSGAGEGEQSAPGQSSSTGRRGPPIPQPTGEPAPKITPQQRREATVANISLRTTSSPPSSAGPQVLPPEFTCDGKNTSPALQWQGVPAGTAELVLFAMNLRPVNGTLFFDWAVAGLSPDLEAIEAGKLPKGAIVGRNGFGKKGYGICPAKGEEETYMFTLFALPEKLSPAQGFDPIALRKEVLGTSGNVGLLALSYLRG